MTQARAGWRWAVVAASIVSLTACGEGTETTTPPATTSSTTSSTTTTPSDGVELERSCRQDDLGVTIEVRYPDGWHVNDGDVATACSAFDPQPFRLEPGTQYPSDLAVVIRVARVPFERATRPDDARIEDERRTEIDGRQAARMVVVASGEALRPEGFRSVQWIVDAGEDRSVLAHTSEVEGNDFDRSVQVLDRMAHALAIRPRT